LLHCLFVLASHASISFLFPFTFLLEWSTRCRNIYNFQNPLTCNTSITLKNDDHCQWSITLIIMDYRLSYIYSDKMNKIWRIASSRMLRCVALVRIDVSEEISAW
jgi:hypothetical protein